MSKETREKTKCHDCMAIEGELHEYGCDMERCPFCGHQLITCDCKYELLNLYDTIRYSRATCFLPPDTYKGGLDKKEETAWQEILESKGRIPWIQYPNLCAKCGALWPDIFMVPDEEWERYVEPDVQGKMLCEPCYLWIKGLIEQSKAPALVTSQPGARPTGDIPARRAGSGQE